MSNVDKCGMNDLVALLSETAQLFLNIIKYIVVVFVVYTVLKLAYEIAKILNNPKELDGKINSLAE